MSSARAPQIQRLDASGQLRSPDARPALIFLHGYYGSALRDSTSGRRIFLSLREILFGRGALSLYRNELATPAGPDVEVEGIFERVSVLPFLYGVDVYGAFLSFASALPGAQLVPVAYDWREDLSLAVNQLHETISALRAKGVEKIAIVAHSMGGVVASYYLGYGNQPFARAELNWAGARDVSHAYFLGTPFRGVFAIFRNMQRGADFKWNRHLLPAEAVASFPASYAMLPDQGDFLAAGENRREPLSLQDFTLWEGRKLGLLANESVPEEVRARRAEFTRRQLTNAGQLHQRLRFEGPEPPSNLRVTSVMNFGRDTLNAAYLLPKSGELLYETDNLRRYGLAKTPLYAKGDGTVSRQSAELPGALARNSRLFESALAHDRLFDEPAFRQDLQRIFSERKE